MVDKKHEDVPQDECHTNVGVRAWAIHLLDMLVIVLIFFGRVNTSVAFLMPFGRVVVAALLCLMVLFFLNLLLVFGLLLQLLCPFDSKLDGRSLFNDIASWRLDSTNAQKARIHSI